MIVSDTNLLVYLLVPGPFTQHAERVRAKEKVWAAPSLLPHELLNVLAQHMRQGDLDRDGAARTYRRGLAMIDISLRKPDPVVVLNRVEQSGCSTYDVEFVWLAQDLDVPLVTADQQVLSAFPDVAVSIEAFAARP